MADLSIFDFLNLPHKPLIRHLTDHINGGNTTSRSHEWDYTDIRRVESWDLFSLETLRVRFGQLFDLRISRPSLLEIVPDNYLNIHSELQLEILLHMTRFTRVNIALQSVNTHLNQTPHLLDTFDKVSERQVISPGLQYGAGKPDLTFHLYADQSQICPIAVGDIKLYAKWSYNRWKSLSLEDLEWTENIGRDGTEVMTANVALFGLTLWAQWAADAHEEGDEEEEEYAELDNCYPEQPSSSPMPSSPPDFHHPASEYLPSSQ
ncbi:hypothetical protein G7Y89_g10930 [Cudoniella acicularis]|uniref:Uncharacterized protein n=1 Tax=Cudoniella acicularis TaxID=354080 RepID=A0A8H4RDB5_9HELO|nr:hypothetical protein G7Y89_g10930 [Cudoniella acicularis]